MKNFLGHDGFVWWIGVVEDVIDPDTLGRCKVRVFGYHDDSTLIPTEDLPWATAIHSPNTPNLYSPLAVGDWVLGFFLDSVNAQEPAIIGVIPSLAFIEQTTKTEVDRYFKRVNTNKETSNTENTTCWELGNNYIEVLEKSLIEPNGHIEISHNQGNTKLTFTSNADFDVYANANATITSDKVLIDTNTFFANVELNATVSVTGNLLFEVEENLTYEVENNLASNANYISLESNTDIRFADANNDVTLAELISWIRRAWSEANSAHSTANSAYTQANTATTIAEDATDRINSPTFNANGYIIEI